MEPQKGKALLKMYEDYLTLHTRFTQHMQQATVSVIRSKQ